MNHASSKRLAPCGERFGRRGPEAAEGGVVIPITVLVMLVLLIFTGIAIDYGYASQRDRNAQNTADAAGLAAALEMQDASDDGCVFSIAEATGPCSTHDPRTLAREYLIRNGWDHDGSGTITSDEADIVWPPTSGKYAGDPVCVQIMAYETADTFFGSLVGADTVSVSASAVACGGIAGGPPPPLVVPAVSALGECGDKTVDWSGNDNDVIGGMQSNDDVKLEGGGNDYSGLVVPGDGLGHIYTNPPPKSWPGSDFLKPGSTYPSDYAQAPALATDPLAGVIDINDFLPGGPWSGFPNYYDFSSTGDLDMSVLDGAGYYDPSSHTLAAGIYFTGNGKIVVNDKILAIGPGADADTIRGITFVNTDDIIDWSADQAPGPPALPLDPNPIFGYASLDGIPGNVSDRAAGDPGLLVFSTYDSDGSPCGENGEVTYQGNRFNTEGVIYAPYSEIRHSGAGNYHQPGALIAETVAWSGNFNVVDSGNATVPSGGSSDSGADLKN